MIDWVMKIIELKAMVDEMDMWAGKSEGHLRAMLGRNADDVRMFIRQIEAELVPSERSVLDTPPAWVTNPDALPEGYDEEPIYDDSVSDDPYAQS